jgi:uncharacterized protein (TIGR02594 family)
MRKSKASNKTGSAKTGSAKTKVSKRTTSRRATTPRSRTSRTATRTRRVSPKSTPPVGLIEIPTRLEQAMLATPPLPSIHYPFRNVLVLFLAVVATTAVGGWAAYVALFGEARQDMGAVTSPVIGDRPAARPPSDEAAAPRPQERIAAAPSREVIPSTTPEAAPSSAGHERSPSAPAVPKTQDRVAAVPSQEAIPIITQDAAPSAVAPEEPPAARPAPEVTAAIPAPTSQPSAPLPIAAPPLAGPASTPEPPAAGLATPRQPPVAVKGKRRGHPGAAAIAPIGPGGGAYALVAEARRYLGTNPTGRKDLWCGAFVDLVLRRLGYKGGGNLASAYARYGKRVPGPQLGAIAVMTRKGGGHVGIVSGFDSKGRPIIISGNYRRTVAEVVYPVGRIYAYVVPKDWDGVLASTH